MKTYIKDELTNEFYCVPMTETDNDGHLYAGDNDFPYWSEDVNEAHGFLSEVVANIELKCNDLTHSGTRRPVIITL